MTHSVNFNADFFVKYKKIYNLFLRIIENVDKQKMIIR